MNYKRVYNNIITRGQNRSMYLNEYKEIHHIVPKCMGGNDSPDNLVELSPEEHYVCHQLLLKMYRHNRDLAYACHMMTVNSKNHDRPKNKEYGWVKREFNRSRHKEYRVVSPDGKETIIKGLTKFCKENNFCLSSVTQVVMGREKSYKGYIIKHLNDPIPYKDYEDIISKILMEHCI